MNFQLWRMCDVNGQFELCTCSEKIDKKKPLELTKGFKGISFYFGIWTLYLFAIVLYFLTSPVALFKVYVIPSAGVLYISQTWVSGYWGSISSAASFVNPVTIPANPITAKILITMSLMFLIFIWF